MHALVRTFTIVGLAVLLAACPKATRPPGPQPGVPPLPTTDLRGAVVYEVNAAESDVAIMVYRAGALARFGHNHVMTSKALQGRAWIHPTLAKSGFELSFPVAQLVVDDPDARRRAGSDFPSEIPQADRDGTRKNMLRAEVLDAENFATVKLQSVRVSGTLNAAVIATRITIKNVSRDIDASAAVTVAGSRLTAAGEFDVQQTAFGIKPFSIGLGALEVQDRLHIKFRIVAQRR